MITTGDKTGTSDFNAHHVSARFRSEISCAAHPAPTHRFSPSISNVRNLTPHTLAFQNQMQFPRVRPAVRIDALRIQTIVHTPARPRQSSFIQHIHERANTQISFPELTRYSYCVTAQSCVALADFAVLFLEGIHHDTDNSG